MLAAVMMARGFAGGLGAAVRATLPADFDRSVEFVIVILLPANSEMQSSPVWMPIWAHFTLRRHEFKRIEPNNLILIG